MRIISALVALPIMLTLASPVAAQAAEDQNTNETNINLKIDSNLIIDEGINNSQNTVLLAFTPYKYLGHNPIMTAEETEQEKAITAREKVLAKWEEKRKNAEYPEGKFLINASAYTAAADECGKSDGITASGLVVKENETIACPPQFPFGTKIAIEGMGTYICQDRGGAIKGNHIDIYMETKAQAFAFGRKNLMAEVIQ